MANVEKKPKIPCFVEVENLNDLARLASALERVALPLFRFKINDVEILAVQFDVFKGTPVFYYVRNKYVDSYLGYRNFGGKEVVKLSSSTRETVNIYAPIISIDVVPNLFEKGFLGGGTNIDKYSTIRVKDLANLCKISLYKIMFEEPPLPLFTFPEKKRWIIGSFTRLDETDEISLFFYTILNTKPNKGFVRYSSVNPETTELTDRIDEHGYFYGKIIKLAKKHPMADI